MSLGSSLSGITFSGLSSGIDSDSIIQKLLQIDAIPIQRLQQQQQDLSSTVDLMTAFGQKLTSISSAAGTLNTASAFNPVTATSSATDVASITTTGSAVSGTYSLTVNKLALAHKISSAAQTDTTSALNLSGTVVINGKALAVTATDTLTTIAQRINGLGAGVTASLVDGGSGSAYLTLASNTTGAKSAIQIADFQGTVASSLGLANGADAIRETITGGATSYGFSDATTSLATLWNTPSAGSKTFTLNGQSVTVDTTTTSLQGLVTAINSANTGATASIRSTTDASGKTVQKLDITGLTSYTDPNGLLESIGVLQKGYGSQVIPAQDASYSLDNINLTSSTNTITTAIPGTTITLLKGTPTAPGVSTLTLNQDSAGIEKNVQNMVDAYNGMIDFVASNSQLDSKTFQTGPLFGDPTVQQVQSQMSNVVFNSVKGLTGQYTNLAQIGFSFDQSGHLTFDQGKLDAAVKANPTDVAALFRTMGTSTATGLNYVSSTSKTTAAGAPLAVNITQAATEGNYVAQTAQTQPVSTVEALTFNGNLFGNTSYTLNISAGSTQDQIVSQINSDSTLKNLMMASVQNGKLVLQSNKYGSVGNFTVSSNQAAASDNSGIGTAGSYTAGVDVAGTINGEAATGSGQFLTGNTGNASTEGLQIQYTGTATGAIGSITFTKGVGASISDLVGSFTDPVNGLLSATTNSLQTEITGITDNITDLQNQLAQTQDDLKAKFSAMESAIAALKNQQAQLGTFKSG